MVESMYENFFSMGIEAGNGEEAPPCEGPCYTVRLAASSDDPTELAVHVIYPSPDYPEEAPCVIYATSISNKRRIQVGAINKEIASMVEENVGTHTVIMVLQHVQEFLVSYVEAEEKADAVRRGEEALQSATEAAGKVGGNRKGERVVLHDDPTIRFGSVLTKELFLEWVAQREEARKKKNFLQKKDDPLADKLTGRELWEQTKVSAEEWDLFSGEKGEDGDEMDLDWEMVDEAALELDD